MGTEDAFGTSLGEVVFTGYEFEALAGQDFVGKGTLVTALAGECIGIIGAIS